MKSIFSHQGHTWHVFVDVKQLAGYFERMSDGTGGNLLFERVSVPGLAEAVELIDYDGTPCLPQEVTAALRDAGFSVGEEFD